MRQVGFYIVDLPIITKKNGNNKQPTNQNETYFMHGNGCRDWGNCLSCPKNDCDWLPYPKTKRKVPK